MVVLGVLVSLPAGAQTLAPAPDTVRPPTAMLRPGDIIRLKIWREPGLSGDFPVDEHGVVVFPKIGTRVVTQRSTRTLERELVRSYRQYLRNPSIDVVLLRRVNILGEVRKPGLHPVDPTMTLADALALAGGTAPSGDPDDIRLIRNGEVIVAQLSQDTRISEIPIRSGDQIYVPERSWFTRNIGTAMSLGVSLFIALFIR